MHWLSVTVVLPWYNAALCVHTAHPTRAGNLIVICNLLANFVSVNNQIVPKLAQLEFK